MEINQATKAYVEAHKTENVQELALRGAKDPDIDLPTALRQIEGWQKAKAKLPSWATTEDIIYPPRLSMEQCSSEITAAYKQKIVEGYAGNLGTLVDLTGGFGVDCMMLGQLFEHVTYVEHSPILCDIARHNFTAIGMPQAEVVEADAVEYLRQMPHCDWIFIDPARRNENGQKVVSLADCEPNIHDILYPLLDKCDRMLIKLSPMHDIRKVVEDLSHHAIEVHVVSVDNECKELLVLADLRPHDEEVIVVTVNLSSNGAKPQQVTGLLQFAGHSPEHSASSIGKYLYEPNASLMKARIFKPMLNQWPAEKLHPATHLFTSDRLFRDFPGRSFEVEKAVPFSKEGIRQAVEGLKQANVKARNFGHMTTEALCKRIGLADGGNTYIFGVTVAGGQRMLIRCHKIGSKE